MTRRRRPGLDPNPKPVSDIVERAVERSGFERSSRLVNKKQFHELTGFDRKTLDDWISKGCPTVGESGKGSEILVDVREVWKWREEQVAKKAMREAMGDGEGFVGFMGIRDPNKAIKAQLDYLKLAKERGRLVEYDLMVAVMERFFSVVKNTVMGIPDRQYRQMAGFPKDRIDKWREDAITHARDALEQGREVLDRGMPPVPEDD